MYKLKYIGNDQETYTLLLNDVSVAELFLGEDGVIELILAINSFLKKKKVHKNNYVLEIKNDDDKLGVIVDIWDNEQTDIIDTSCFWFDDFIE